MATVSTSANEQTVPGSSPSGLNPTSGRKADTTSNLRPSSSLHEAAIRIGEHNRTATAQKAPRLRKASLVLRGRCDPERQAVPVEFIVADERDQCRGRGNGAKDPERLGSAIARRRSCARRAHVLKSVQAQLRARHVRRDAVCATSVRKAVERPGLHRSVKPTRVRDTGAWHQQCSPRTMLRACAPLPSLPRVRTTNPTQAPRRTLPQEAPRDQVGGRRDRRG